jgi:phage terminase large subunit-like protein
MSFHASDFAKLADADLDATVDALTEDEAEALRYDWAFWVRPEQRLPDGDWINWLILAGHGWSDGSHNYLVGIDAPERASQQALTDNGAQV